MIFKANRINSVVDSCGSARGMVELNQFGEGEGRQPLLQTLEKTAAHNNSVALYVLSICIKLYVKLYEAAAKPYCQ